MLLPPPPLLVLLLVPGAGEMGERVLSPPLAAAAELLGRPADRPMAWLFLRPLVAAAEGWPAYLALSGLSRSGSCVLLSLTFWQAMAASLWLAEAPAAACSREYCCS